MQQWQGAVEEFDSRVNIYYPKLILFYSFGRTSTLDSYLKLYTQTCILYMEYTCVRCIWQYYVYFVLVMAALTAVTISIEAYMQA